MWWRSSGRGRGSAATIKKKHRSSPINSLASSSCLMPPEFTTSQSEKRRVFILYFLTRNKFEDFGKLTVSESTRPSLHRSGTYSRGCAQSICTLGTSLPPPRNPHCEPSCLALFATYHRTASATFPSDSRATSPSALAQSVLKLQAPPAPGLPTAVRRHLRRPGHPAPRHIGLGNPLAQTQVTISNRFP